MSATYHELRDDVTQIRVVYANCAFTGTAEFNNGPCQITGSVALGSGTPVQVRFGGSTTYSGSDDYAVSDWLPFVAPKGSRLLCRQWYSAAAGIIYNGFNRDTTQEGMNFGTTTPDLTAGGAFAPGSTDIAYVPIAILAMTSVGSIMILGDSMCEATNGNASVTGDVGLVAPSVGPSLGYVSCARGGDRLVGWTASMSKRAQIAQWVSDAVIQLGYNDVFPNSRTAVQSIADRATVAGNLAAVNPALRIHATTITPNTTSTDAWATEANQTLANSARETERRSFNALTKARPSWQTGRVLDVARVMESPKTAGIFAAPGNADALAFTSDGTHPTMEGYERVRRSGLIRPEWFRRGATA